MNPFPFSSATLGTIPYKAGIESILRAALLAVDPGEAVRRVMKRVDNQLFLEQNVYPLDQIRSVRIVGAGKAGYPMAEAAAEILGQQLAASVVIVKDGHLGPALIDQPHLKFIEAGHPIPDQRGIGGAAQMRTALSGLQTNDLVIALISGGGSALLAALADDITLADLQELTVSLLACGATIQEINTLRKHLDLVKGGGMARMAAPAQLAVLILSDVVGDPLDVIASGPTVPDPTTFTDAYAIITRYDLLNKVPPAILDFFERGMRGELVDTPKPGDPLFDRVNNIVIGNNYLAAQAAVSAAREAGYHAMVLTTYLQGEARQAGLFMAGLLRQVAATGQPLSRPACLVIGGETTVAVFATPPGLGGRNQELALGSVKDLAGVSDILLIALATDGGDGPTEAAGAVVSGDTWGRARALGLAPNDFLQRNDAYHFFAALDDLLVTGPTQTNVNDLVFLFAF